MRLSEVVNPKDRAGTEKASSKQETSQDIGGTSAQQQGFEGIET